MSHKALLATLTMLMLLLQACGGATEQESLAELEQIEVKWTLLQADLRALDDSLLNISSFCTLSSSKLKNDALALANSANKDNHAALTASFLEEKEKIEEIAFAFEDFKREWAGLTKELAAFKQQLKEEKVSSGKLKAELAFYGRTLEDAETIVAGLRASLEEAAIAARSNFASYEKELVLLDK